MSGVDRRRSTIAIMAMLAALVAGCAGTPTPSGASAAPDGSSVPTTPSPTATPEPRIRLGISNSVADDPWRAAMICSAKAEARASGRVERVITADRGTDAAGQAADIANLVATGVDAIIVVPEDPAALADAVSAAVASGVTVVAVRRPLAVEGTYTIGTDQEAFGTAGATWLAEAMGGKGSIVYLRGRSEDPIDTARDVGVRGVLAANPDLAVTAEIRTEGDPATAVEAVTALVAEKKRIDGIWTGGTDHVVIDALKTAEAKLPPIVGTDRGPFVSQLLAEEGLVGAAVTDPPATGGAAVSLILDILDGDPPAEPLTLVAPEVWANDTDAGRARLGTTNDPAIELGWPLSLTLPGRTTAAVEDVTACQGPEG